MRIAHVTVHHFRSIRHLEMDCQPLMVLLGPNNHGKSNIISALEFLLSTSSKPSEADFFSLRPPDDRDLWVEAEFVDLTAQEKNTFKRYVDPNGRIKIRKSTRIDGNGTMDIAYRGYVAEPSEWWLKGDAIERLTDRHGVERESQGIPALKALLQEKGKITKKRVEEFQTSDIEANRAGLTLQQALEESPLLGTRNVGGGVMPDFYLVPAIRDLSDETKVKTTTVFGRLLQRAVQEMAERDPQFIEVRQQLEALIRKLNAGEDGQGARPQQLSAIETTLEKELESWGVKVSIEVTPPELEKVFELGTHLHLDDGLKTLAEQKGHGLQRAVIFALLRAWARVLRESSAEGEAVGPRKSAESLVFAVEEPELFLHPHAQRRLASAICEIADTAHHQIFVCTHSTHFINLDRYRSIAIVSKYTAGEGTIVRQCSTELFAGDSVKERKDRFHMASWVNPDRAELFFAKLVVLVEGETEAAVLPYLGEKMGCFRADVSVIDCGSKYNLPLYMQLLNAFGIQHIVVHDEDPLPDPLPEDWDEKKREGKKRAFAMNQEIQYHVKDPLGRVEVLSPEFEVVAGVSKTQGEKKGKALAALEHFQRVGQEAIRTRIQDVVRAVYGGAAL